jgi:hydroxypyruvate isomerase
MVKLSGCIEMLFKAEHDAVDARIRAAGDAGLDAVEFWSWRNKPLDAVARALRESGLSLSAFSCEPRCAIVDPATHGAFLDAVRESVAAASRLGAPTLIVLTGDELADRSRGQQHEAIITALKRAAPIAADAGVVLALEPLNTRVDHAGYYLSSTAEGLDIVEAVGSTAVRLLYDVYHSAVMGERAAEVLAGRGHLVHHVHLADTPGRHEPGSGRIDWHGCMAALRAEGYTGPIGLEYRPSGDTVASLRLARSCLQ